MAHDHDLAMSLADTAALQHDPALLAETVPPLFELARRDRHGLYLAIAHRAQGIALTLQGLGDPAEEQLTTALDLFHALGTRWQLGRTRAALGDLYIARGETSRARDAYAAAAAEFQALRAEADLRRAQATLSTLQL